MKSLFVVAILLVLASLVFGEDLWPRLEDIDMSKIESMEIYAVGFVVLYFEWDGHIAGFSYRPEYRAEKSIEGLITNVEISPLFVCVDWNDDGFFQHEEMRPIGGHSV